MTRSRLLSPLSIGAILLLCGMLFILIGSSHRPSPEAVSPFMSEQKSELKIEVLKEGAGAQIMNGQTAVMYYIGSLDDRTVFDKNQSGKGFSFPLGAGKVIQGWEVGVLGMKVGEQRRLIIPPNLGYGPSGVPGVIPPHATLHFDVELRAIE
jgi:FKBP-type peptidyl-prolyl cis-trans isomerase